MTPALSPSTSVLTLCINPPYPYPFLADIDTFLSSSPGTIFTYFMGRSLAAEIGPFELFEFSLTPSQHTLRRLAFTLYALAESGHAYLTQLRLPTWDPTRSRPSTTFAYLATRSTLR